MHILPISALLLYLLSAALSLYQVYCSGSGRWKHLWTLIFLGFLCQCGSLYYLYGADIVVVKNGADYYFWVAWLLIAALLLGWRQLNFPIVNTLVSGAAALFLVSSSYLVHLPSAAPAIPENRYFLLLHIVPALIAEVCLVLAFIMSAVFLWQDRKLKRKDLHGAPGPSLALLDLFQGRILLVGFFAMTIAVLSGVFWAIGRHISLFGHDLRGMLAYLCWAVLALLLHLRVSGKVSSRKIAHLTVSATGLVFAAIFVLMFGSGKGLHEFAG